MHEVLGENKTEARIPIQETLQIPNAVGIGALEGLEGEITILDGHSWVAASAPESDVACVESSTQKATFLAISHVPSWVDRPITREIEPGDFESVIREQAIALGVNADQPFPFVIKGRLTLDAHVVRGFCPHAGGSDGAATAQPISFSTHDEPGTLVGFYAREAQGSLTHMGSRVHVHALLNDGSPRCGHVDSVYVAPDSMIRLPAQRPETR